jgi:hypothetical protein
MIENLIYYYLFNLTNSVNGCISPTYKQVRKIYKAVSNKLKATNLVKSDNKSELMIELINGSSIQFFSAENYDSIRGNTFTGILLCDEFAFFKSEACETSIKPTTLVHCKKVAFFSTPKGKENSFAKEYYKGLDKSYNKHKSFNFSSYENPFIDREELDEYKRSLPEAIYKQEVLGEFIDSGSDVFRNVNEVCSLQPKPFTDEKYSIGIDLGNKGDYTVVSIFNKDRHQVRLYRFQKSDWNGIIDEIKLILKGIKSYIAYVESNGVGNPIYDNLRKEFGNKVREWITTASSKEEMINNLIYAMDKGEVKLLNDDNLKSEMETFTFVFSKQTGKVSYGARTGFHDDTVMATAIGYKCALENKNENKIIYRSLK